VTTAADHASEQTADEGACDGLTLGEARKHDELTQLRAKLADKTREYTILHHQLDAAATAIAALHHAFT
jgi:hypothetical protein